MSQCQLTTDMKSVLREKLIEIRTKIDKIDVQLDKEEGCLFWEITGIEDIAHELEEIVSFYHLQSFLFPNIEGLDEISKVLNILSAKRHGALIAIEQKESLDPYIIACNITGVSVGAQISAPLLQSIFYPGNPLHDGGVVIRQGQIISAGCVFPLSEQKFTKEGRKIGTRHRAALGLSEKSDAVVFAVSEETGIISFAQNGVLIPIKDTWIV